MARASGLMVGPGSIGSFCRMWPVAYTESGAATAFTAGRAPP